MAKPLRYGAVAGVVGGAATSFSPLGRMAVRSRPIGWPFFSLYFCCFRNARVWVTHSSALAAAMWYASLRMTTSLEFGICTW